MDNTAMCRSILRILKEKTYGFLYCSSVFMFFLYMFTGYDEGHLVLQHSPTTPPCGQASAQFHPEKLDLISCCAEP